MQWRLLACAWRIKNGLLRIPKGACYACARVKQDSEFVTSKGKRRNICKSCANQRQKEWFKQHPEVKRNWVKRNAEHVRQYRAEWLSENKDRHRVSQRRAYAKWRADPAKRKFWTGYYRDFMRARRSGEGDPSQQMMFTLVERACSQVPDEFKESVYQDLFVGILAGEFRRVSLRPGSEAVKECIRRAYQEVPDRFGHRSLDAPQGDAELSWSDLVEDETDYGRMPER